MISQFLLSLITGLFVGGVSGYLGSLMITKRMALVGDALGHVALPGIGLALFFGLDVSIGAVFFLLIGVLIIWFLESRTNLSAEALVGVLFVVSLALGFLIIPDFELLEALIGDISSVSLMSTVVSAIISVTALIIIYKIYNKLILSNVSGDLALVEGVDSKKYNLFYLLLIALVVSIGVKVTGSLLVGALVIIPAAAAKNLSANLRQYSLGSLILGGLSCSLEIIISEWTNALAGPVIILVSASFFLISLIIRGLRGQKMRNY